MFSFKLSFFLFYFFFISFSLWIEVTTKIQAQIFGAKEGWAWVRSFFFSLFLFFVFLLQLCCGNSNYSLDSHSKKGQSHNNVRSDSSSTVSPLNARFNSTMGKGNQNYTLCLSLDLSCSLQGSSWPSLPTLNTKSWQQRPWRTSVLFFSFFFLPLCFGNSSYTSDSHSTKGWTKLGHTFLHSQAQVQLFVFFFLLCILFCFFSYNFTIGIQSCTLDSHNKKA